MSNAVLKNLKAWINHEDAVMFLPTPSGGRVAIPLVETSHGHFVQPLFGQNELQLGVDAARVGGKLG